MENWKPQLICFLESLIREEIFIVYPFDSPAKRTFGFIFVSKIFEETKIEIPMSIWINHLQNDEKWDWIGNLESRVIFSKEIVSNSLLIKDKLGVLCQSLKDSIV